MSGSNHAAKFLTASLIFLFFLLIFLPVFEEGDKWGYVVSVAALIGVLASPVLLNSSRWDSYSLKIFAVLIGWYCFLLLHRHYFPPGTDYAFNKLPYLAFVSIVGAFLMPAAVENVRAWNATAISLTGVSLVFTIISFFPSMESANARYSAVELSPTLLAKLTMIPIIAAISFRDAAPRYRVVLYLAAMVSVAGCVNTGSRTPLIAICIAYMCYLLVRFRFRELAKSVGFYAVLGGIFLIYLGFANPEVVERFSFQALSVADHSDEGDRIFLYRLAADVIQANPLGIGLGNFSTVFWINAPHNIFLEAVAETGWFGVIPLLVLTWIGLRSSIQLFRTDDSFAHFISTFFFYNLVTSFVGNELTLPSLMYYLSIGLSAVYTHSLTDRTLPRQAAGRKVVMPPALRN